MSFSLTDEQIGLRDAARELFTARAGREARRAYVDRALPYDTELWKTMSTELGLHGILIPEQYGGGGGTLLDLSIVLEESGATLLCSPFFATVVLAATAIAASGDDDVKGELLPAIANGELIAALAYRSGVGGAPLSAASGARGWTVSGSAFHVIDGAAAQAVLVIARTDRGHALLLLDADADGLTRTESSSLDPTRRLAALTLTHAPARLVGPDGAGTDVLRDTLAVARVGLAAEQVGGAQRCLDMSVEHVQSRQQFGRAIGSFQAIKHRCADMFVDVQCARAATLHAAWAAEADPEVFATATYATAALVSDSYFRAATQSIQLHGGIGYTWEHEAHLYLKRAMSSARMFGTAAEHREKVASAIGL
jgi:alkylation response protein AidB-like acyl-CoA dehydrogenase